MIRWAAVLTVLAVAPAVGQTPTFSSKVDIVRVDALVTENGRLVRGLAAEEFEVLDNGVPQQVTLAAFEDLPIDVVMTFDMSGSVSGERLAHLRGAGDAVLDGLRRDDRGGLLTFSHRLLLRQELTLEHDELRLALDGATPAAGGETAVTDATYAALLLGQTGPGRDLLIVFSDGLDTISWLTEPRVIESARRADTTVYGVTVRENGRSEFLEKVAEATGGSVVAIESTKDLSRTFRAILDEFRQRYVLSYTPTGVSRAGWHTLQVKLKGRRGAVRARSGYFGG